MSSSSQPPVPAGWTRIDLEPTLPDPPAVPGPSDPSLVTRPELNGLRVRVPGRREIYLIDRGVRRWLTYYAYVCLMRDWNGVYESLDIDQIALGPGLEKVCLMRPAWIAPDESHRPIPIEPPPVYLVEPGVKRHVADARTFDHYHFAWGKIIDVARVIADSIPDGDEIERIP